MRRTSTLVALLPGFALASLSGTVALPSGSPLKGVAVTLAKTSGYGTATTDAQGRWSLSDAAAIRGRDPAGKVGESGLLLENGRIAVRYAGGSADGRGADAQEWMRQRTAAARSLAIVDTLRFSWNGTVRTVLAVGRLDTSGIATTLDTVTVDEGISTVSWATGCSTTKVSCVQGTWTAGGPDPDHSAYKLVKESDHFAIYSDETISDATATSALATLENTVWQNLFNSNLLMPEPFCKSSTKTKAAIHVHSGWGLTGGGWDDTHIGMWISADALSDHWGLTHEFTHSWQAATTSGGGMSCGRTNTCGWIHESHANFTPHQLPEYADNVHCSEMLGNAPHLYLGSTRDRYCNWQFMEYLKDKYCPVAVNDIWTTSGADPFANIQTSHGWTVSQLNDFFGEWAMHNVTWDYKVSGSAFRSAYGSIAAVDKAERLRRIMPLEALDSSAWQTNRRFVSPFYGAPQRFGYNVVRLHPVDGATTVTVKFRGVLQTNADFRWGLVATDAAFATARYSALQRGTDGNLAFRVKSGEPLFLVVTATPSVFQSVTWDQEYNTIPRYPYMVELANAWPAGFQNGMRDACPSGLARHANGGGCAPASTPSTVYVGPYATVMTGATVTGSARIEDEAVVFKGSVSGGTIGGLSIVGSNSEPYNANAFAVSGTPTVRTSFYPLGYFEANQGISGTANVYGDVEYRGAGTNRSSGNLSGFIDPSSTTGSATDVNRNGPWSWRN